MRVLIKGEQYLYKKNPFVCGLFEAAWVHELFECYQRCKNVQAVQALLVKNFPAGLKILVENAIRGGVKNYFVANHAILM